MFESWCKKIQHIYGVDIHEFVEFGADPENNPHQVEDDAESTLHSEFYYILSSSSV